jgi:D-3-phosphoglycerate dehydrogenase
MVKTSFPKEKIKVLLLEGVHPVAVERFKAEGFSVQLFEKAWDAAALEKAIGAGAGSGAAHVLGIRSKTTLTAPVLASAKRLMAVGCFCIGTNQVALGEASQRGVAVFNSPFSNTRSVAELTLAEIIALHRRMVDQSAAMHTGNWDKSAAGAHEVRGRTLGIVGYGHIGTQVSILAEALGMRVMFFDILSKLSLGNARACRSLEELLKASDVVTLHVPETAQTKGMVGKAQIKLMKKGAFLINNARGSVVDIPALAEALKSKHLAGAALDVFPYEPAGRDEVFKSELLGLPNVILTPHVGGSTEEAQESIAQDVCDKLIRFMNVGATSGSVNMPVVDLPEQGPAEDGATDGKRRSHRILHLHKNVPGVMSKVNAVMGEQKININAQYLQTKGEVGYVVFDIEPTPTKGPLIVDALRKLPETIKVRALW